MKAQVVVGNRAALSGRAMACGSGAVLVQAYGRNPVFSDAVGNEFKVAALLGHSDTRITRGYVHHDVDSGKVMDDYRENKLVQMKRRA
jgi:hypothetical protein